MLNAAQEQYAAVKAEALGCDVSAFASNALMIVERPPDSHERFLAMMASFGTGTVISVVPELIDVVRGLTIEPHYRAYHPPVVVQPLIEAGAQQGLSLGWRGPNLVFLPASNLPELPLPDGFRLAEVDAAWRAQHLDDRRFSNALGEPGDAYVASIWRGAMVAFDAEGEPAAVAGTYDDGPGLLEIGVDVARAGRGTGLGRLVVAEQARRILAAGLTPTYYTFPANVRSQRTALSCGFLPSASLLRVVRNRP